MKLRQNAKNAIFLGTLCSVAYLGVYVARNVLGAVTPQMIEKGFSEDFIGSISSLYFIMYAVGQLINGAIGDKIKARYMISCGLLLAGVTNLILPIVTTSKIGMTVAYAMTGFFLAMIYGPMTKVVSENTEPIHATRCSLGYTLASFLGSPAAGMFAAFMAWQNVFYVSSGALIGMAVIIFCCFLFMEKKGIVRYGQYKLATKSRGAGFKVLIQKHALIKFVAIAFLTGIVRTSVVFWLTTYISQRLGYSSAKAASIFTIATFVIVFSSFASIFTYERFKRNRNATMLLAFSCSAVLFFCAFFIEHNVMNIVCMVGAIFCNNMSATMLWSTYCPSLRDTGMVSSATGFLDFCSYMAAALANKVFPHMVAKIGWANLVLVWCALMVIGVIVALPWAKIAARRKQKVSETVESAQGITAEEKEGAQEQPIALPQPEVACTKED